MESRKTGLPHCLDYLRQFFRRHASRESDTENAAIVFVQLDLLNEPIKLVDCDPVARGEESGGRAQQRHRSLDPKRDLVVNPLDRLLKAALVLFVREFRKVIVSEDRKAQAQQENQIGQENATLA